MLKAKNNSLNLINLCKLGHCQADGLYRVPNPNWGLGTRPFRYPHDLGHGGYVQKFLRKGNGIEGVPAVQGVRT